MNIFFSAFLGATSLCTALSFHMATKHIEAVNEFTDWFFNRVGFKTSLYLIAIVIAFINKSAGRPGSKSHQFISKAGDSIVSFYASTVGAAFGWILGFCSAAIASNREQYLLISIYLCSLALIMFFSPPVMAIEVRSTIEKFNKNHFRKDLNALIIRRAGDILLIFVLVGVIHDFFFRK